MSENKIKFFIGPEVEHTPAFSKKTLFVVGEQSILEIIEMAKEHNVPHIYLAANQSFELSDYWDKTITPLLEMDFMVTLDYPAQYHGEMMKKLNPATLQSRMFVPMLSVKISDIDRTSPNLTVKIDDEFNGPNDGVWCFNYHELMDSNKFTGWQEYTSDEVVEYKSSVKDTRSAHSEQVSESKNQQEIGLDPDAKSMLKPEEAVEEVKSEEPKTINETVAAYAKGAKSDPLGKKATTKKTKAK